MIDKELKEIMQEEYDQEDRAEYALLEGDNCPKCKDECLSVEENPKAGTITLKCESCGYIAREEPMEE